MSSVPAKKAADASKAARETGGAGAASGKRSAILEYRYPRAMRRHRVYPLVVGVPKKKGAEGVAAGVVVVRPVIPGALVTPAERRLDLSSPGNEVAFDVTPLAKGKLRHAQLEVHTPHQPPTVLPLGMRTKSRRLALLLLVLAFVLPWLLVQVTTGPWGLTGPGSPWAAFEAKLRSTFAAHVVELPLLSTPASWAPDFLKDFTLTDALARAGERVYFWLYTFVDVLHGASLVFFVLLGLALIAWLWNRPGTRFRRKKIALADPPAGERVAPTLMPL
jgi:hypothetical protein